MRAINIDVVCLFYFGGSYNDSWERWTTDRKQIQTYQKKKFQKNQQEVGKQESEEN